MKNYERCGGDERPERRMMGIVELTRTECGAQGSADGWGARDAHATPLREPFGNSSEFVLTGGIRIFVGDQPGALPEKDQKQRCGHDLRPSETLG